MPSFTRPLFLCCLLLLAAGRLGAHERILFTRIGLEQGLSQGAANCVLQDRQGFVWVGTQDGLNRFDGYSFRVFRHNPADPRSIHINFIESLHEDSLGGIWASNSNLRDTVSRFDPQSESFVRLPVSALPPGARRSTVLPVYTDPWGVRWTGSADSGLTRLDPHTGERTRWMHDPGNPASLSDNRIYSITGDRAGRLWIGTRRGLNRFDPSTGAFTRYLQGTAPGSLSDNWVWPILEDAAGTIWVGTVNGGLNRFDRNTGRFTAFRNDPADPRSLSQDYVISLAQDRSGVIWVGTAGAGLNTFHPGLMPFQTYAHDPQDPASLADNPVTSLRVDRTGTWWVGTRAGISLLDPRTNTFTHLRNDPRNPRSLGENAAPALLEDRAGRVWIGTYSSGIDLYDRGTGTFTHHRRNPADPGGLRDNRIYSLLEDRRGTIWAGTYGGGLHRYDPASRSFRLYARADTIPGTLSADGIWALTEDRSGTIWLGTFGGGLNSLDPATGRFTVYRNNPADSTSLSDDLVLCITEDRSGMLWVGTTGGLNRLDRSTGSIRAYRKRDGLANEVIFGILEDARGALWMSTNDGLIRFDPRTEEFRTYDANHGLQGNEFNQNAWCANPLTGQMGFGGPGGLTIFHPDSVRENPYIPPVVFSVFRRYNTDDAEGRPIQEPGIAVRPSIVLTYKDNIASFDFAALSFFNTPRNRYQYRLEGFNESWIQLGTERRATFTNLDPGEYTLHVRGSNNDGIWNDEGASLGITVLPPWWRTTWAYGIYIVLLASALYGIRRFEINRREQKMLVRESELRAKAAEAENRALEAENARKTKELEEARALQLSMLPHEVPNVPGLEIAVYMRTATEVGGDYYDFHTGPDGELTVAFGDATGHGMQAGTIVTLVKGMFTSDASRMELPAFFNHCSRSIKGIRLGRLLMAFSMLRFRGTAFSFSSAGMPPLFIHRRATGAIDEVLLKAMPIGSMRHFPYQVHEDRLDPGDTLLLLSDGLPEQKNAAGDMFDYARVADTLRRAVHGTPEEIIRSLMADADSWMANAVQDDDITLLAIRAREPGHPT